MSSRWGRKSAEILERGFIGEVVMGNALGVTYFRKYGRNIDIDTGTTPEDLWNGGGIYTGQPISVTPELVTVSSSSVNDVGTSGTGAHTILLEGLDGDLATQSETIILNGTSLVDSVNTWRRVPRATIMTAGSLAQNDGVVTIAHKITTANVFVKIQVGTNRTTICANTVPGGCTGVLNNWHPTSAKSSVNGSTATLELLTRKVGGLYIVRDLIEIPAGSFPSPRDLFITLDAGEDVVVRCTEVSANDTVVTAAFSGCLFDHTVFGT